MPMPMPMHHSSHMPLRTTATALRQPRSTPPKKPHASTIHLEAAALNPPAPVILGCFELVQQFHHVRALAMPATVVPSYSGTRSSLIFL